MLLDEDVDAARVGFHQRAGVFVHRGEVTFGGAREAEGAELFVGFQSEGADDFGELAARGAAHEVELPETILRHDVALGFDGVGERGGADVRDAPVVALDGDFFLEAGEGDGAVELGKGAVDEAPRYGGGDDENYGEGPDEDTNDGPQAISRRWK